MVADIHLLPDAIIVPCKDNIQGTFQIDRTTGLGIISVCDEYGSRLVDIGTELAKHILEACAPFNPDEPEKEIA